MTEIASSAMDGNLAFIGKQAQSAFPWMPLLRVHKRKEK
jgi:hypothetical protein